jgi:hypothetical protein
VNKCLACSHWHKQPDPRKSQFSSLFTDRDLKFTEESEHHISTMSTLYPSYLQNPSAVSVDSSDGSGSDFDASGELNHVDEMSTTEQDQVKEVEEMARIETKNMRAWKLLVFLTILATATLVSTGTYIFLKGDEDSSFEESYNSFASTIGDAFRIDTHNLFSTMRSCSSSISGVALAENSTFPFVTVPTFEILGESVRQQSGAEAVVFTPKVELGEVTQWQEYAIANEGWYEESKKLAISYGEGSLVQSNFAPGNQLPFIYESVVDENGNPSVTPAVNDPPFYPVWQHSPPPFSPALIKASFPGAQLKAAGVAREGILDSSFFSDPTGLTALASTEKDHKAHHSLVSSDSESAYDRPHFFLYQPIFREIYDSSSEIVGYVTALITWDRYFSNLLPEGVKGITCVVSNTCGQSFTYYLDGERVSCAPFKHHKRCLTRMAVAIKQTN